MSSFLKLDYDKVARKNTPSGELQAIQVKEDPKQVKKARKVFIIGIVAGTITSLAFLPQVIKAFHNRAATRLTWVTLTMAMLGQTMWLMYGTMSGDRVITIFTIVAFLMYAGLVLSKFIF